jgi:hypothetical protein
MAKRRRRSTKSIPLTIGQDPSLWRFGSLQEALEANTDIISDLIRASQPVSRSEKPVIDEHGPDEAAALDTAAR